MSETPRTDAAIRNSDGQWSYTLRETCEQLERELAEVREDAMDHKRMLQSLSKTQALDRAELDRSFQYIIKQRDTLEEALVYAQKEHEARIAIFAFDGPVISAERERLEKRLEEAKHNATTTREDALAAVKGGQQ